MTGLHTFIVTGGGRFPVSMLRFDACWPMSDEDAAKIEQTFDEHVRRWEIRLQTSSRHAPTDGRWESFSCHVEPVYS